MSKTKYLLPLILILLTVILTGYCATYTPQYPTAHSDTYVKATSFNPDGTKYKPYRSTDPALSLTGSWVDTGWNSHNADENQRFHIDLGSGKIIRRIYYENAHHEGGYTTAGAQNFTFWGSNNAAAFAELTYGTDTNWTVLTVAQNTFDQHVGADQADPKYIIVTNTVAYRYYAFKFADSYGDPDRLATRHTELQTEDGYTPPAEEAANIMFTFSNF